MTDTNNFQIDIAVPEERWESALPGLHDLTKEAVNTALSLTKNEATEISIVFANNTFIQGLNNRYRNKDKPTNVLSFPQDDGESLGDVVLALETIEQESTEQKKALEDHVKHLIVHGTLHLLGLDHENDVEAAEMEALEIRALKALGVKNPYEII
ncbi:MAG: endoribonuclease YbeY [Micavibrio sp.]|nr:MAG: endoribonuclease YbeY [Micavibrio sp.]